MLSTDGSYQLMEVREVKRSDDWWRFACADVWRASLPSYNFEHTPREALMPSYTPRFLFAFHFDHLYIFLKSIAAIIHLGLYIRTPGSFRLVWAQGVVCTISTVQAQNKHSFSGQYSCRYTISTFEDLIWLRWFVANLNNVKCMCFLC